MRFNSLFSAMETVRLASLVQIPAKYWTMFFRAGSANIGRPADFTADGKPLWFKDHELIAMRINKSLEVLDDGDDMSYTAGVW